MNFKGELDYLISGVDLKTPFLKEMKKNIAKDLFVEPSKLIEQMKLDAKNLVSQDKKHVEPSSKSFLEWAAILVACDDVLLPIMSSNEDRIRLIKKSILANLKHPKNSFMKKVPTTDNEKLTELASKTIKPYGNEFSETIVENEYRTFKVSKCFYHDYFIQKHKPYLTQIMCSLETLWYEDDESINKCNLRFCKDDFRTIAKGNDVCLFKVEIEMPDNRG